MNKLLIFAGTTEGRKLSEYLARNGIDHTVCVATEYGEIVLTKHPLVQVHQGKMNQEEIKPFIQNGTYLAVVDATHPYAEAVTGNIKAAMEGMPIPYLRLKRGARTEKYANHSPCMEEVRKPVDDSYGTTTGMCMEIHTFQNAGACAKALKDTKGNILLTTGSKDLAKYCAFPEIKSRLYVRTLPSIESLSACQEQGICGRQVIAMQGPFSVEINEAIIRQYNISYLVTKESGKSGGYYEKIEAARRTGTKVFVIGHPKEEGILFPELCSELEKLLGKKLNGVCYEIILAGVGMGHENCMTKEVWEAVSHADILLGAERMIEDYQPRIEKRPYYQAAEIIPYLEEMQEKNIFPETLRVVVLFSGDSGFFSGNRMLYHDLQKEIHLERLNASSIKILPGISSVSYLASCIGESYHDAAVYSMHGKEVRNLARKIKNSKKTFLLMSGVKDVNRLGETLLRADMPECEIVTGYQLSYKEQEIAVRTPQECLELKKEGLYTCFVKNQNFLSRITHGRGDAEFIRDKIPMTKEEVREIAICKLHLHDASIVYDIGSGTGSIAVEIASLSDSIWVYAIEQRQEAAALIEKNKEKFSCDNISIIHAAAPDCLTGLPAATHAFIGGSGGRLKDIISSLYRINPDVRVVLTAVSIETVCEIRDILNQYPVKEEETIQIQISKAGLAGRHHLMRAQNPVWLCAFRLKGETI